MLFRRQFIPFRDVALRGSQGPAPPGAGYEDKMQCGYLYV